MPLSPGDRLGPYEIVASIGKGGMGEVWLAHDPRLNRDVAIKVSARDFTDRFEREARVVASLNHANICTLYDIGPNYLVMEYIAGPTLAERIARGPIPMEEALGIAKQVASGLEEAHEKGVVHRDLKPANVKLRPNVSSKDGSVKVLDFGLAQTGTATELTPDSPTMMTIPGMILGTAAYMSPEQAAAQPVDKRADIWAFGVVLYEMLTGQRLFQGDSVAHLLADVLRGPIDLEKLPKETPRRIRELMKRCLDRDVTTRLRDIGEARVAIAAALNDEPEPVSAVTLQPRRSRAPWAIAAALGLAAVGLALVHFREQPPPSPISARYQLDPPERFAGFFQISPDGRYLAMVAQRKLWIRPLGSLEAKALDGVEDPTYPFWSPDSASVGFFAQNKLKKVALDGGSVQTLCDAPDGRGAAWSREGVIVFSLRTGLQRVSAAGGVPAQLTRLSSVSSLNDAGQEAHRYPVFLPDGRHFLFVYITDKAERAGIYAGSLAGESPLRLVRDVSNPGYAPGPSRGAPGYLLFVRERTLMALPFDAGALRTVGEIVPVAQQVSLAPNTADFAFSISANGVMAYRFGQQSDSLGLAWVDRTGNRTDAASKPLAFRAYSLAPDQTRLAVAIDGFEKGLRQNDIWRLDSLRGTPSRFTYGPTPGWNFPVWSPNGSELAFATLNSAGLGSYEIHRKHWNMAGKEELLLHSAGIVYLWDWSRDGKWLLYSTAGDLWLLPLEGDHKPLPFTQSPAAYEDFGQFSPDGRWIAYASNESGLDQIYVQPFPATGAKWQVSTGGGSFPRWRSDGKELFFVGTDGKLMAVPIATAVVRNEAAAGAFEPGAPEPLFDGVNTIGNGYAWPYQPGADGRRFLVALPPAGEKPPPITMVLNWQAALKK